MLLDPSGSISLLASSSFLGPACSAVLPVPRRPKIYAVELHVVMSLLYGVFAAAAAIRRLRRSAMILALSKADVAWTDGLASEISDFSVISMKTAVVAQRK